MWVCCGCGGILSCSDWRKIVVLFRSIACNFEIYAAHRRLLLQAAAAEDASRAGEHVESSDTMRSRKAQCQAPPHKPETGDTYRSRERSCAGEKIEHQNVYKLHSSSHHPPPRRHHPHDSKQHHYWVELVRVCRLDVVLLPQRVALIMTTRTHPRQTRHGLSEGSGVAHFPPSPAGRQAGWYRYLWPRCLY